MTRRNKFINYHNILALGEADIPFLSDILDYLFHSTSYLKNSPIVCSMTKSCFNGFLGDSMHCNVGVCAIILEWSVVEKSEPEMAGCCTTWPRGSWVYHLEGGGRVVLHDFLFGHFFSSFTFFPAHSVSDYVGLSPRGREGGSYVPAIPTAAAADQNLFCCDLRTYTLRTF